MFPLPVCCRSGLPPTFTRRWTVPVLTPIR
jgi:hypothetical protein